MNHTQARQFIQAAADGLLSEPNRRALERHLATCQQCQAYSAELANLESRLSFGLQTRWQDVQPRRFSLQQAKRAASVPKRSTGIGMLYQLVAVPAFQLGALAVLAVGLIVLIGTWAASPHGSGSPHTPTPSLTPPPSLAPGGCTAVANIDAHVYAYHDTASAVLGALPHGQTSPVHVYYVNPQTNQVWLQIDYNGTLGWVTNPDTLLGGDCSHVPTEEPGTAVPPTGAPLPTATPAPATLPLVVPTKQVCELVAPSPQTLYADASLGAAVVGTLDAGQSAPILAWAHNGLPPAWFQVRVGNVTGWVWATWYDPGRGAPCSDLPLTAWPTLPPTPVSTPTTTACVVAPDETPTGDHNVYAGPANTYPVLGTLNSGSYVIATGLFTQDNYDTWIRIDFNGQDGWMSGGSLMFAGGGCWPLPPVDFTPHPPTFTPNAPVPTPTDTQIPGDASATPQASSGSTSYAMTIMVITSPG